MEDFRIKYRPRNLEEVWGNEHIKMIWSGFLKRKNFPKAVILYGNFGTGKTTLARIMGQDIIEHRYSSNLLWGNEIKQYNSATADFLSIRRRIENINSFAHGTNVFFFDEAHRVPDKAQDGFLDIIENMNNFYFIFATTDIEKIDKGIWSRSTRFNLRLPSQETLIDKLGRIAEKEDMKISKEALKLLVECSDCIPRECLGNLQSFLCYEGFIDEKVVRESLNLHSLT